MARLEGCLDVWMEENERFVGFSFEDGPRRHKRESAALAAAKMTFPRGVKKEVLIYHLYSC